MEVSDELVDNELGAVFHDHVFDPEFFGECKSDE